MKCYDSLQQDPGNLKKRIREGESNKDKVFYAGMLVLRAVLIVCFAIFFISTLSGVFGAENSPMAVALFCGFLAIRFVNYGYCIKDSLVTLALSMLILLVVPCFVPGMPPILALLVHLIAFFSLVYMTCQQPEMGNGGLYGFAYVYLVGNPVQGTVFVQRAGLTLVCYLLFAAVMLLKHRKAHTNIRFHHLIGQFSLSNPVNLWQIRLTIGVSLVLTLGTAFDMPRFMWVGFACSSLLAQYPYTQNIKTRFIQRIGGALVGTLLFVVVYLLLPESFYSLVGPIGGFCLGFCSDYRYKTVLNCFGALMAASAIYGLEGAVFLRVANTILGAVIAGLVAFAFHKLLAVRCLDPQACQQQDVH